MAMKLMDADHAGLVIAAQAGDDRAREKLIAAYLPLLYNIVGRALSGHSDVDDVVQETLLRVLRDLPALRAPESFRSWLVSITLRQVNAQWQRQRAFAGRAVETLGRPAAEATAGTSATAGRAALHNLQASLGSRTGDGRAPSPVLTRPLLADDHPAHIR